MPVPASINDLSPTAGNNSPAGSESPTTVDDYLRTHAAFIASLRDSSNALVKQTSVTDTASGSLLLVGAFGWNGGNATPLPTGTDANTITTPGAYMLASGGTNLHSSTPYPYLLVFRHLSDNYVKQLAFNLTTNAFAVRNRNGGVWSSWDAQYGTQNVSAFIQTLLDDAGAEAARDTLGLSSVLLASYASAEQTITAGGLLTLAHGLGSTPKLMQTYIVCKTAEAGYSVGDVLKIEFTPANGTGSQICNFMVSADAANLYATCAASGLAAINKSNGALTFLTTANWRLIVRAFA